MNFSYNDYSQLTLNLRKHGYTFSSYHNWKDKEKCVILRHDIDYQPSKALEMARIERHLDVSSTYFVLISSDFYNVFSSSTANILKKISSYGHELGLHFDEVKYEGLSIDEIRGKIIDEARLLEQTIEQPVTTVSMHRPSKAILEADLKIPGIINSYGEEFFRGFKYLSDSRRRWRECVEEIIESQVYNRLHILTHAFWYNDEEIDIHDSLERFVNSANQERYEALINNITDLASVMGVEEIKGDKYAD